MAITLDGSNGITTPGGATTDDITFADNDKAIFGAGSDLQIYSDGTHGIIKESGSGDLLIYGNNLRLGNADGSELYILGNNNAEVQLRYDNATKLATTSTGIDVTGTALNLDGGGSNPLLTLKNSATYYSTVSHDTFNVQNNGLKLSTQGTERMRIDSSGKVGIGTSSPSYTLEVYKSSVGNVASFNSSSGNRSLDFTSADNGAYLGAEWDRNINSTGGIHTWSVNDTERMRIDSSGNLLVGKTSASIDVDGFMVHNSDYINSTNTSGSAAYFNRKGTDGDIVNFQNDGSSVGSISVSGSSTAYNTSSDYRLKENVVDLTGASARVNQLDVKRFNFIADDTNTLVDGFLAHEVADVVPEAITGTKDAVDDDGNPEYQGIDQSKLVPLLTAALQEALTEIASLKTRVEALEA